MHSALGQRLDTGREASGSRADGGWGFRRGSGIPEVRKRYAKVGHLHRRAAFRTSTAGNKDIPPDVMGSAGRVERPGGSYPRTTTSKPIRAKARRQRGRCSAKGVDASRAGRSSRSRSGRVVRSNANAVKKLNTPGQRSREDSGVHPGRSLFSREEAVGVEATRPPAAFSIGAKGCSWRGGADHVPARRYSSRIPRLVTVWPDCVSRIT